MNSNHDLVDIEAVLGGKASRLVRIASLAEKWNIRVSALGFWVSEVWLPAREPWYLARKILMAHIKKEDLCSLARRRPNSFGGLSTCNDRMHKKLLKESSPWDQCLLMKLWTGAVLTREKSARMREVEPSCSCGCPEQTLFHVLWECPDSPPVPDELEARKILPPSLSLAHVLPQGATKAEVLTWKTSCRRAIGIIKMLPLKKHDEPGAQRQGRATDTKGHVITLMADSMYAFCARCYISRRVRDMKWIWLKPCMAEEEVPR